MSDGMAKKPRLSKTVGITRPYFQKVHAHVVKHLNILREALNRLETDWASFCFVEILKCNADEPCNLSSAYCKTLRNIQDPDDSKHGEVWMEDMFDVKLIRDFLLKTDRVEKMILDKQLVAIEKLAQFSDTLSETNKILKQQLKERPAMDNSWAAVIGTHVLRRLAVSNQMTIDSSCCGPNDLECPCGCRTFIKSGDNSMGHESAWHGSIDLMLGQVAVSICKPKMNEEETDNGSSDEKIKLEEFRHKLISKCIVFASAVHSGIVPLIGLSEEDVKIFMYDSVEDLLFELAELPLFCVPPPLEGRQLNISTIVALWMTINCSEFFTGVKSSHVDFGYKANFKKFLDKETCHIYENEMKIGGLKHTESDVSEFKAGGNPGRFKRIV